ncbi:MAG: hypothetical protein M1829_006568 [Trizodia sp. TS-e1964]|nr:MAG: hypothetical protein M1829_006568 [Trizodia sp. TS-e1964]
MAVYRGLASGDHLYQETPHSCPSMLERFVASGGGILEALVDRIKDTVGYVSFFNTFNRGKANEREFKDLIEEITAQVMSFGIQTNIRFASYGQKGLPEPKSSTGWIHPHEKASNASIAIKPDFFLTKVPEENCSANVMEHSTSKFSWEDVRILWEIQSHSDRITSTSDLANLLLKASQALRFQANRAFFLAFYLCREKFRMARIDRCGAVLGHPVTLTLNDNFLKAVVACLIFEDKPIGLINLWTILLSKENLTNSQEKVIWIKEKKFVLGPQVFGPRANIIQTRATSVFMADSNPPEKPSVAWKHCLKISWPYTERYVEGQLLEALRHLEGVASVEAWESIESAGNHADYVGVIEKVVVKPQGSPNSKSPTPPAVDLYHRELRVVVMQYIQYSFSDLIKKRSIPLILKAWRDLYHVVTNISNAGWAHKELSWTNVRVTDMENGKVKLIDFDLACRIPQTSSTAPDRTGTPAFMAIEILNPDRGQPVSCNMLHEYESVFWIGYLALTKLGADDSSILPMTQRNDLGLIEIAYMKTRHFLEEDTRSLGFSSIDQPAETKGILETLCTNMVNSLYVLPGKKSSYRHSRKDPKHFGQIVAAQISSFENVLSECTSIPVPAVIDAWEVEVESEFDESNTCYIVMKYIEGQVVADIWETLDTDARRNLLHELSTYIHALGALKFDTPGPIGGGASKSPLFTMYGAGPFASTAAMEE